jgi:hypothetical protein
MPRQCFRWPIYSLNPAKARQWTRRLRLVSHVLRHGVGSMCLAFTGCYLAQNEETTDVAIMISYRGYSIGLACWGGAFFLALLDLRALQKTLTPESSTGKTPNQAACSNNCDDGGNLYQLCRGVSCLCIRALAASQSRDYLGIGLSLRLDLCHPNECG